MSKVMVVCQIKDAGYWVKRYIHHIEALEDADLHIVCIYGDSIDATLSILKHWSRITKHQVDIYHEPYLPPEERQGWALARIKREFQQIFLDGDDDYYFVCDPDNVYLPPNLLSHLIAAEKDVIAPYVWTEGRRRKTFYDAYGFRLGKYMFHPFEPPGIDATVPVEVDCVGNCYLASHHAMEQGVYSNPFPHLQFCYGLRDKGLTIWADPTISVSHVDLERYGIKHYQPDIPLSHVMFVNRYGVTVKEGQVIREEVYQAVDDYASWVEEHHVDDAKFQRIFDESRPLLTASYKVLNEAEYLPYSLASVYPYVDRIDIVEGSVSKHRHTANKDGSSTDDTIQIIKDFPDPNQKIRLLQGKWRDKEQMQQKLLERCESRWMLYIDGDELYPSYDLEQMRQFCLNHVDGDLVYAIPGETLNFWHDWQHVAYSLNQLSPWGKHSPMHPCLIWRDIPGLNFNFFHTYPMDGMGRNMALNPFYADKRVALNNICLYHYGHAKSPASIYAKLLYFQNRRSGEVPGTIEENMWFSGTMPDDFVITPFQGEPPEVLQSHPMYGQTLIKVTAKKPVYQFERLEV